MLTPVVDGVVVHGRTGALVVDPGITATELACLGDDGAARCAAATASIDIEVDASESGRASGS